MAASRSNDGSYRDIASTCQGCLSNCPVRVQTCDGRFVRVVGNERSRATQGAVCPALALSGEQLDDPDRICAPLRRTNPRKGRDVAPDFVEISWQEAIDEIADRMLELREAGLAHTVAFAKGRSSGIGGLLHEALPTLYGTPNRFNHDSICAEAEKLATGCLDGVWDYHDYDWAKARCVVLWGTDPLASNRQKSHFRDQFDVLCSHARVYVLDPRRSMTAQAVLERDAGRWLCVVPGTDGALACAMAHVMLVEGLWNRDFVGDFSADGMRFTPACRVEAASFRERHTSGLCTWWNEALKDATPEWAARICGIAAEDVRTLAREFAGAGSHAVSWVSPGIAMTARGLYSCMAAYALNGLVGSVDAHGSVLRFAGSGLAKLAGTDAYLDGIARTALEHGRLDQPSGHRQQAGAWLACGKKGHAHANATIGLVPDAIAGEGRYELNMLILCWGNWAFSCSDTARWHEAFSSVPFLVTLDTHVSETSHFADIVLPARHHLFETWGFAVCRQNAVTEVSLQQPCVEPLAGTHGDETDFPFDLARAFAERGFPGPLRYYEREYRDPCTGEPPRSGDELGRNAVKRMTRPLWDAGPACSDAEHELRWRRFVGTGVCESGEARAWAARADTPAFATPSGTFEFESASLRTMFQEHADALGVSCDEAAAGMGFAARGACCFVPHHEPPVRCGDARRYPFVLSQHRSCANLEGRSANAASYHRLKRLDPGDVAGQDVVKLHPSDMEALGLSDGDAVRIVSELGSIDSVAVSWDGTQPGVVVKCYGQGHWAYGHNAAADFERRIARGGNANDIMPLVYEPLSASIARHGGLVRVRVQKA